MVRIEMLVPDDLDPAEILDIMQVSAITWASSVAANLHEVSDSVSVEDVKPQMSLPMEFSELSIGDYYISFPLDGDDSGHGGYRGRSFVFTKLSELASIRLQDRVQCSCTPGMRVLRVIV